MERSLDTKYRLILQWCTVWYSESQRGKCQSICEMGHLLRSYRWSKKFNGPPIINNNNN